MFEKKKQMIEKMKQLVQQCQDRIVNMLETRTIDEHTTFDELDDNQIRK